MLKPAGGSGWPDVAFPDGWGREGMCSLAFVHDAEDLASCDQTGRGFSIRWPPRATRGGA